MQLHPYLYFEGNCKTAFEFYEQCLNGKIEVLTTYKGSPMANEVPSEWGEKVMHAEFRLSPDSSGGRASHILMGTDAMPGQYEAVKGVSIMLNMKDSTAAERIFNALAENGKVTMPIEETFWAAKFGMVVDRFGIPWTINCEADSE